MQILFPQKSRTGPIPIVRLRLKIKVGVSYSSDPFWVRDLLLRVADTNPRVLRYPECRVLFVDFGESSLDFELRVWINDPQEGIESVRSALRFEIWKIFKENGIEIPFPQRDLYIKNGLEGLSRSETPLLNRGLNFFCLFIIFFNFLYIISRFLLTLFPYLFNLIAPGMGKAGLDGKFY